MEAERQLAEAQTGADRQLESTRAELRRQLAEAERQLAEARAAAQTLRADFSVSLNQTLDEAATKVSRVRERQTIQSQLRCARAGCVSAASPCTLRCRTACPASSVIATQKHRHHQGWPYHDPHHTDPMTITSTVFRRGPLIIKGNDSRIGSDVDGPTKGRSMPINRGARNPSHPMVSSPT